MYFLRKMEQKDLPVDEISIGGLVKKNEKSYKLIKINKRGSYKVIKL